MQLAERPSTSPHQDAWWGHERAPDGDKVIKIVQFVHLMFLNAVYLRALKKLICPCPVETEDRRKRESLLNNVHPTQDWAQAGQSGTGSDSKGPEA